MEYFKNKTLEILPHEEWVDAFGLDGIYEVSNFGRVKCLQRTVTRVDGKVMTFPERVVSQCKIKHPFTNNEGLVVWDKNYSLYVRLTIEKGVCKNYSVGGLILNSFRKPDKYNNHTHHINGISYDNRLQNLAFEDLHTSRKIQFANGLRSGNKNTKHWKAEGWKNAKTKEEMKEMRAKLPPRNLNRPSEHSNKKTITVFIERSNFIGTYTCIRNASEQLGIKEYKLMNSLMGGRQKYLQVKYGSLNISDFIPAKRKPIKKVDGLKLSEVAKKAKKTYGTIIYRQNKKWNTDKILSEKDYSIDTRFKKGGKNKNGLNSVSSLKK